MKKLFVIFILGILTLMVAQSCSNDANEVSEMFISNEKFEIIANPHSISEEAAIAQTLAYFESKIEVSTINPY